MDSITECSTTNESSEIPLTEQTTASNLQSPTKTLKKCSKKRKHELEILEAGEKEFNDEKCTAWTDFYICSREVSKTKSETWLTLKLHFQF